jgi:hypothetical protein
MRIYQQVLDMGGAAVEVLESVVACSIEEAFTIQRAGQRPAATATGGLRSVTASRMPASGRPP